jgi:transcriptional regulator with XRE-family HTH domain
MKRKTILLPKQKRILETLGENIRYARLRRKLSTVQVAERANISRKTLYEIERGSASAGMGSYLQVLMVLGIENDLELDLAGEVAPYFRVDPTASEKLIKSITSVVKKWKSVATGIGIPEQEQEQMPGRLS